MEGQNSTLLPTKFRLVQKSKEGLLTMTLSVSKMSVTLTLIHLLLSQGDTDNPPMGGEVHVPFAFLFSRCWGLNLGLRAH
jgi:hypothetical protein